MKKIYGIAFASAALMLASCANNDDPNVVPNPMPEGGTGYVAVRITTPNP